MNDVMELWHCIHERNQPEISHEKMLKWFLAHMDGSVIDYMEEYLYEFVISHFKELKLLQKKLDFIQIKIQEVREQFEKGSYFEYKVQQYAVYCLQIMGERKDSIEDIRDFASEQESDYVDEKLAEIEMEYGNLDRAIAIYQTLAVKRDIWKWEPNKYRLLLKEIYKNCGDTEKYFHELKLLVFHQIGNRELYEEYKAQFTPEKWEIKRDTLFAGLRLGDHRANTWYEIEGRYDRIMDNIEVSGDTTMLQMYEKNLRRLYPERCLAVLTRAAEWQAEHSSKRADYRNIAQILRWMMIYPDGIEMATQLAEKYRAKYLRRSAMLDELSAF